VTGGIAQATLLPGAVVCCSNQSHALPHSHTAGAGHLRIESQLAAEAPPDVAQNVVVADERIRIHDRHGTAAAQRGEADDDSGSVRVADVKFGAWPGAFVEPGDAADEQVRPQPTDIAPEHGNGAVGRHQQRRWVDITDPTSIDPVNNGVCGTASSLSPFALFEVKYAFGGFLPPVDPEPTANAAKAGSSIPVKFSLGGDQGWTSSLPATRAPS
jgi:hypothetical protein